MIKKSYITENYKFYKIRYFKLINSFLFNIQAMLV